MSTAGFLLFVFSAVLAMPLGRAEPPMMTFQPEKSMSLAVALESSMCKMVGTQCEKVTFSSRMYWARVSGA